jgi:hypothetical protein
MRISISADQTQIKQEVSSIMSTKAYALAFDGYWRAPNVSGLPTKSGIYGVYACVHNTQEKTVSIKRLLYLGEAANMQERVSGHERWPDWRQRLNTDEELCFNAALISGESDRQRAEAAMIFKHKPPCNTTYVDAFPFDATTVTTSGNNALMQASFTVQRTEGALDKGLGAYGRR